MCRTCRKGEIKVAVDENLFFLNKRGDISFTISPSIKYLFVEDDTYWDLEDGAYEGIERDSNETFEDLSAFKGIIDEPYLNGFMNSSYKELTDYDPNSAVNQLRSSLGLST
jgi:hypothetical protein